MKAIQLIESSNYQLTVIESLKASGFDFKRLNNQEFSPSLVCALVMRNYGLGIRILLACGLDLEAQDLETGDSPLLLVASEGLCGPVRALVEHLNLSALLQANRMGNTPLRLLLRRGHGACGCLGHLLDRFPVPLLTENRCSEAPLLFSVSTLLDHISCVDVARSMSVIDVWTTTNLLLLPGQNTDKSNWYALNTETCQQKLLYPVMDFCLGSTSLPKNTTPSQVTTRLMHLLFVLIVLDQVPCHVGLDYVMAVNVKLFGMNPSTGLPNSPDRTTLPQSSTTMANLQILIHGLQTLSALLTGPIALRLLALRATRRWLQMRMQPDTAHLFKKVPQRSSPLQAGGELASEQLTVGRAFSAMLQVLPLPPHVKQQLTFDATPDFCS